MVSAGLFGGVSELSDADAAFGTVSEMLERKVAQAMALRIRAWERATLEAAFDAGLDVRRPWGPELAAFAQTTWNLWMDPRRQYEPGGVPGQFAVLRNFDGLGATP